jgi:hypothetical protein
MNIPLQNLYDHTMRRHTTVPGKVREELRHTVRYTDRHGSLRYVLWHDFQDLTAAQMEALVDAEIADARLHASALCWRIHETDNPAWELERMLLEKGFKPDADVVQHFITPQALLARLQHAQLPNGIEIRELVTPRELSDLQGVWDDVWPDASNARYVTDNQNVMESGERGFRYFAAFDGPLAVSSGSIVHIPGNPFALLVSGATRRSYAKRGIYHAMVAARAQTALAAGVETLAVDASSESAPVLAKLGFAPQVRVKFVELEFKSPT